MDDEERMGLDSDSDSDWMEEPAIDDVGEKFGFEDVAAGAVAVACDSERMSLSLAGGIVKGVSSE